MLSRRGFLFKCTIPVWMILSRCVSNSASDPIPEPTPAVNDELMLASNYENMVLIGGDSHEIQWKTSPAISHIHLFFSTNNGVHWEKIAENIPASTARYLWTIPQKTTPQAKIRITATHPSLAYDSTSFAVKKSLVLSLKEYPHLTMQGKYQVISTDEMGDIVVMNDSTQYTVINTSCTHAGCATNFDGTEFRCPCHGSVFNKDGNVTNGPAPSPLQRFSAKQTSDERLLIY